MSIVSNNIKYLRRLNGLTQEQFARKIAIKRSLLGAYEEARANPNLTNLKNMAAAFGITVDNLLKNDLRKLRETPDMSLPLNAARPMTVSHSGPVQAPATSRIPTFSEPQPLSKIVDQYKQPEPEIRMVSRQVNLKPVNGEPQPPAKPLAGNAAFRRPEPASEANAQIPVFNNQYPASQFNAVAEEKTENYPTIQWVAKDLQLDYIQNCQNPSYLNQLPSFQLPNLPAGYYRAFESGDDFMYPGSLLVGTFVRNWYDIKDGMQYVFVLRQQGFIYRTAFNHVKTTGFLLLTSDDPSISTLEVPLQEVLEVWEINAFISLQMPVPQPSLERVSRLVDELQLELSQYKQ